MIQGDIFFLIPKKTGIHRSLTPRISSFLRDMALWPHRMKNSPLYLIHILAYTSKLLLMGFYHLDEK
jgi:hypothetical protein